MANHFYKIKPYKDHKLRKQGKINRENEICRKQKMQHMIMKYSHEINVVMLCVNYNNHHSGFPKSKIDSAVAIWQTESGKSEQKHIFLKSFVRMNKRIDTDAEAVA